MRLIVFSLACLLAIPTIVGSQEAPPAAQPQVVADYKSMRLDEVLAKLAKDTGYKTVLDEAFYGDEVVKLNVGTVSLDLAGALLALDLDCKVFVHHKERVIEVLAMESVSGHTSDAVLDLKAIRDLYVNNETELGPILKLEADPEEPDLSIWASEFAAVVKAVLGIDLGEVALDGSKTDLTRKLTESQAAAVRELIGLLTADSGGHSASLAWQQAAWLKLQTGKLKLTAEQTRAEDVLTHLCRLLGLSWVISAYATYEIEEETVTLHLPEMPALDLLALVLGNLELSYFLAGGTLAIAKEDEVRAETVPVRGYAVYNIGALIEERVKLPALKGETKRDLRQQASAEKYLTTLGWKK